MNFLPASVFGVAIYYSSLCLEQTKEPIKVYRPRPWQSARKAALVQKKWTKRWGCVQRPCFYKTPGGIYAHPALKEKLESALAREQIIRRSRTFHPEFYV